MGKLFISYRRADNTKDARAVYERLRRELSDHEVFVDLEGIEPGEDFVSAIEKHLDGCDALIVLIGKNWITATDDSGSPRLLDENDFVRIEILSALRRGIRIFPVLLDDAAPPQPLQLPESLREVARRQAMSLDYARFDQDIQKLAHYVDKALKQVAHRQSSETRAANPVKILGMPSQSAIDAKSVAEVSSDLTRQIDAHRESIQALAKASETKNGGNFPNRMSMKWGGLLLVGIAGLLTWGIRTSSFSGNKTENGRGLPHSIVAHSANEPVTEAEARAQYELVRASVANTLEYRASHIIVKTESTAKTLIAKLNQGESFSSLAQKYSVDPDSSKKGGDLDWAQPDNFVTEFSTAMTALNVGQTTQVPVKTKFGYHIIRLDETRTTAIPKFEEVKEQIVKRIEQSRKVSEAK